MNHRGKRSERSKQRRDAKQFIFTTAFQDYEMVETIATVERTTVLGYLGKIYEMVFPDVVDVEKGLVLSDSRGRGVFQK